MKKKTVVDCPVCGCLHLMHFDGYAGIDGDFIFYCQEVGRLELADAPRAVIRDLIVVEEITS